MHLLDRRNSFSLWTQNTVPCHRYTITFSQASDFYKGTESYWKQRRDSTFKMQALEKFMNNQYLQRPLFLCVRRRYRFVPISSSVAWYNLIQNNNILIFSIPISFSSPIWCPYLSGCLGLSVIIIVLSSIWRLGDIFSTLVYFSRLFDSAEEDFFFDFHMDLFCESNEHCII